MKDNTPAFPQTYQTCQSHMEGMTLRDYFAAKAMQAFLQTAPSGTTFGTHHNEMNDKYARASYSMADSMLKERK